MTKLLNCPLIACVLFLCGSARGDAAAKSFYSSMLRANDTIASAKTISLSCLVEQADESGSLKIVGHTSFIADIGRNNFYRRDVRDVSDSSNTCEVSISTWDGNRYLITTYFTPKDKSNDSWSEKFPTYFTISKRQISVYSLPLLSSFVQWNSNGPLLRDVEESVVKKTPSGNDGVVTLIIDGRVKLCVRNSDYAIVERHTGVFDVPGPTLYRFNFSNFNDKLVPLKIEGSGPEVNSEGISFDPVS